MDFSAPGSLDNNTGIQCASGSSNGWIRSQGTSLAAPAVSGLAAYFISINPQLQEKGMKGMVAQMVKDYVKSLAWSRNGGPIAIWNNESYLPPSCRGNVTRAVRNKREVTGCSTSWFDLSSTVASGILSASESIFRTESLTSVLAPTSTSPLASSASSARLQNIPSTSPTASSSAASTQPPTTSEPTYSFSCDNTSLEDGDGICTCSGALIGTLTTIFTPPGGPGNVCPTIPPSKELASSTAAGSSTTTATTTTTVTTTPEATCTAVANIANTAVTIWTNYITDSGNALKTKEIDGCPGLAGWTVFNEQKSFAAAGGAAWVSSQSFQFTLQVTHPQELTCVQRAIVAAGGPTGTPQCSFAPAISPP
jgi:hypothetical protein